MKDPNWQITEERLNEFGMRCNEMKMDRIHELSELESSGGINNVIVGRRKVASGIHLVHDSGEEVHYMLFYISAEEGPIKGYEMHFELMGMSTVDRIGFTTFFARFLEDDFKWADSINIGRLFNDKLSELLEKIGFFTHGEELFNLAGEGESISMVLPNHHKRGTIFVPQIDPLVIYRMIFGNKFQDITSEMNKVYLLYKTTTREIKIGHSKNVKSRLSTLRTGEPQTFVITSWEAPQPEEDVLHEMFKERRKDREWFRLRMRDLKDIRDYMGEYSQD